MVDTALASLIENAPVKFNGFAEANAAVVVPFASEDRLNVTFEPGQIDRGTVTKAVDWISNLSADNRQEAEQALFIEYLSAIEHGSCDFDSAQAQLDWEAESTGTFSNPVAAESASDIWSLVRLHTVHVQHGLSGELFIDIEGEAAWDGEHGVALRSKNFGPLAIAKGF